jgi:hypothetical protein
MLWLLHERWKVRLDDRTYISFELQARTSAVGSTCVGRLELLCAVLWWLFVCSLFVYSYVYVHDAHTLLLAFVDDEYWRASHFQNVIML